MKVAIGIPCLLRGGTEMQTLMLSRALSELGHDVTVICYHEYLLEMVEEFEGISAKVILLQWKRKMHPFTFILKFRQLLDQIKPDAVHIQYIAPGFLPIIASRLANVKKVFGTVHQPGTFYPIYTHWIIKFSAALCTKFTCVSRAVEQSWFGNSALSTKEEKNAGTRKHFTLYNAVDIKKIDQISETADSHEMRNQYHIHDKVVVGTVSRLRYEKGVDILLNAFSLVLKEHPSAMLLIIGDGEDKDTLLNQASSIGIEKRVIWTGELSWESAVRHRKLMDLVVCPSRFEGFGLVAAESMAMSKPVIASRIHGFTEVIDDGLNGWLFNSEDFQSLASEIKHVLSDSINSNRTAKNAKDKILRSFSYQSYKVAIEELYNI